VTSDDEKATHKEIAAMFREFTSEADLDALRLQREASTERHLRWMAEQATKPAEPAAPSVWETLFAATAAAESPIEHKMLRAIILRGATRAGADADHIAEIGPARLYAQLPVGQYRVDIALVDGSSRLVVECDGRAFHGTDAQVLSDRRRDRELTRMGWRVIRYSGSEIHKNADACAAESLAIFDAIRGVR
jgi:very-short-patch-repair endonuclease